MKDFKDDKESIQGPFIFNEKKMAEKVKYLKTSILLKYQNHSLNVLKELNLLIYKLLS